MRNRHGEAVQKTMALYRIAGLNIEMEAGGRTAIQAVPYAASSDSPADVTIRVDIPRMMELNPLIDSEDLAEYLGTGSCFARRLLNFRGFMLHSSAIILDGKAYLFSAPSGTGKSTHTEKWIRLFGAEYLNDDKPALRLIDGVWMAFGTPWSGKHDLSKPTGVPLGGIAVLQRGEENTIQPMDPAEALPFLMSQTAYKLSATQMDKLLVLLDDLLRRVPVWELFCRNEDEAAVVSRTAMTAGQGGSECV